MQENFDGVIVVGAGPVGLIVALKVARSGIPVLVLECEPEIVRWPRAIVYHAPTVQMLDRLGLLDELKVAGILKQDYQFRTVTGEILAAPNMSVLTPQDTPYPFNLHMPQHELARVILENLLRLPGTQIRWNARVTGLAQDSNGATVTVDENGETREIRCRYVVGADGGRSTVRQLCGLSFDGYTHPERLVSTNLRYDFEARGFARANFVLDPVHWAVIVIAEMPIDGFDIGVEIKPVPDQRLDPGPRPVAGFPFDRDSRTIEPDGQDHGPALEFQDPAVGEPVRSGLGQAGDLVTREGREDGGGIQWPVGVDSKRPAQAAVRSRSIFSSDSFIGLPPR